MTDFAHPHLDTHILTHSYTFFFHICLPHILFPHLLHPYFFPHLLHAQIGGQHRRERLGNSSISGNGAGSAQLPSAFISAPPMGTSAFSLQTHSACRERSFFNCTLFTVHTLAQTHTITSKIKSAPLVLIAPSRLQYSYPFTPIKEKNAIVATRAAHCDCLINENKTAAASSTSNNSEKENKKENFPPHSPVKMMPLFSILSFQVMYR